MLKSNELRLKARESLKGKYWAAFLATIITSILVSIASLFTIISDKLLGINLIIIENNVQLTTMEERGFLVIFGMALILALIGLVLSILVTGPSMIGCCKYFIKNNTEKPALSEVFSGFSTKYGRNIGANLLINVKLVLWTLLFIVPGIIKAFEYSIIPYILADDSEISTKDAFKKAKQMMTGNKWRLFKLNISFIGWILLSFLTLGIGALFLVPYIDAANAQFYAELKDKQ